MCIRDRTRTNSMKISNAARLIFWLAAILAIGILVRAESSEKRANTANAKSAHSIRILDQNGNPAVSGVPSVTGTICAVDVGRQWPQRQQRSSLHSRFAILLA